MIRYSEKELQLIEYFDYDDLIESIEPVVLYNIMKDKAFLDNMSGCAVDSLRRCILALNDSKIYRLTEEWDDLIQL